MRQVSVVRLRCEDIGAMIEFRLRQPYDLIVRGLDEPHALRRLFSGLPVALCLDGRAPREKIAPEPTLFPVHKRRDFDRVLASRVVDNFDFGGFADDAAPVEMRNIKGNSTVVVPSATDGDEVFAGHLISFARRSTSSHAFSQDFD
jgi:hypothetical protein